MAETLAVGFFDGVHLGHQCILSGAREALTFRNHPLSVLAPARAPRLIMSFEDRIAAIRSCGVEKVTVFDFTPELANLPPADFAAAYLAGKHVRCGVNWRFGKGGKGDGAFLRTLGYEVTAVSPVYTGKSSCLCQDEIISSTRIRAALEAGRTSEANAMMGRPYQVRGVPFVGKGEGQSLGYPTVNLRLEGVQLRLPLGVYAVEAGGCRGVANYGRAPTFGEHAWKDPVMEIHFLGEPPMDSSLATSMTVRFGAFIRPERTFASLDALKAQIATDIAIVRAHDNV